MSAFFPPGYLKRLRVVAIGEVGQRESGTNGGPAVLKYQRATWLDPGPWPWCAAFVCWCMREAARQSGLAESDPLFRSLPRCAAVSQFVEWAKKTGLARVIVNSREALPSDLVLFRFPRGNHIGIVHAASAGGQFGTVEGNTDASGGREGDGVYRRSRSFESVSHILRLNEG